MAVGRHGEMMGDMALHVRNILWLCIVRIFLHESKSQPIPHDGCLYMAANMDRNWIEYDRNVIGYGSNMDRILIGRGKGQSIQIEAWCHARLLAVNRVELIGYGLNLT